jgi:hypothetical protein
MGEGGGNVGELQSWLRSVLGEDADWEVTPDTLRILHTIRQHNLQQENIAKVSVADPGCLSRIRLFSIPDLNCLYPGSASNKIILTPKNKKKTNGF